MVVFAFDPRKSTVAVVVMLSAGAIAASAVASQAGPCFAELYSIEARIDAWLNAKAAAGPIAEESSEALLHRQPTPRSIATAESRLGTISPQKLDAVRQSMARAHEADSAGDLNACRRALSDVEPLLAD
jgi:hypothetical protein